MDQQARAVDAVYSRLSDPRAILEFSEFCVYFHSRLLPRRCLLLVLFFFDLGLGRAVQKIMNFPKNSVGLPD